MTYLELLIRIKQNAQPAAVEFDGDIYKWDGKNYKCGFVCINQSLDEVVYGTKNCIKALKYEEEEDD